MTAQRGEAHRPAPLAISQRSDPNVRNNRSPLFLSATTVAVAIVALAVPPAVGQSSPPTPTGPVPPEVVNSWALTPSGDKPGEPGSRPNLSHSLAPGAQVKDSVTLLNYSNVQLTFRVYATDAFNNVDGQFDLLTAEKTAVGAGTWVTLPQANVTVPALSSATLPITITVPPDARPGDHAAAVLAASQADGTGPDGKVITLDRRTGSRLYVRVAGPMEPTLVVEKVRSTYHPTLNPFGGSLDVSYTVRNNGNVRLAAKQRLALQGPLGLGLDTSSPVDVPELLPGSSVTLRARFGGVPATVLLATTVTLTPLASKDALSPDTATEASRRGREIAMPWSVLALVLTVVLSLHARRAYRRHQVGDDEPLVETDQDQNPVPVP